MNKTFMAIILSVCLLGMALAMFSERLSREPERGSETRMAAANSQLPNLAASNGEASLPVTVPEAPQSVPIPAADKDKTFAVAEKEKEMAEAALAPPPAISVKTETETPGEQLKEAAPQPASEIRPVQAPAPKEDIVPEKPAVKPEPAQAVEKTSAVTVSQATAKTDTSVVQETKKVTPAQNQPPEQSRQGNERQKSNTVAKAITNFVVFARDKGATIRLGANNKIKYNSMTLEKPDRVVVDLDGDWQFPSTLPIPKNEMVNAIRVGKLGDKTRVVIDLKAKPRLSRMVEGQNGTNLDIRVDR